MISTTLKLEKYIDYFNGREDYVAVQGSNHYYPIAQELNESVVIKHLEGLKTFGVYVLTKTSKCNFICIDIDIEKSELSKVNFADSKTKFEYLREQLLKFQKLLEEDLFKSKNILYEDSGGRGYHIWVFFEKPIEGYDAIFLNEILKHKLDDFTFEFFPKQPDLNNKRKYGNLIKLPLGEHKKYNNISKFFTLANENIKFIDGIENNLNYLNSIEKVKNSAFHKLIANYKKTLNYNNSLSIEEEVNIKPRPIYKSEIEKLFFQCNAMNALKDKALKGKVLSHKGIRPFNPYLRLC